MLLVEFNDVMQAIEITCDEKGADTLIQTLTALKQEDGGHIHLRAGTELAASSPWGRKVFTELIIEFDSDLDEALKPD
jgi:hypothetical protein